MKGKTKDQVTIKLPGRMHPSINEWKGWSPKKYSAEKHLWADDISLLSVGNRHLNWDKVIVNITYYSNVDHSKDHDNYTPKLIMDALQVAGIIQNDTVKMAEVDWDFKISKTDVMTVIRINHIKPYNIIPYSVYCRRDEVFYDRARCATCGEHLCFSRFGVYCRREIVA